MSCTMYRLLFKDFRLLTSISGDCIPTYLKRQNILILSHRAILSTSTYNGSEKLSLPHRFVQASPRKIQPFLKLSRIDTPIGTWLLFWPCTWGLTLGAQGVPSAELITLFGLGAFLMRGAGCTINDMWDRRIDAAVSRTKSRPLASKQLRLRHAAVWLSFQLSLSLMILLYLPPPCFIIGLTSLGLVILYPLAKRVTNWPQGVLGLTFNTGILLGYTAAVGNGLGYLETPWIIPSVISMYTGAVAWTLLYDTIYAHQDREDDSYLGLGSTARKFGENSKMWLSGFGAIMVSSLALSGYLSELSWPYYISLSATTAHILWQIKTLDIKNGENCAFRFRANRHIGWLIFAGILGSYALVNPSSS